MDNLIKQLKLEIASSYNNYVLSLQKGYPFKGYAVIKEAIFAVEYCMNNVITDTEKEKILNYHILKLSING